MTGAVALPSPLGAASKLGFRRFLVLCEVIMVVVRLYLRYRLSYRDVEELLAERGVEAEHVTV